MHRHKGNRWHERRGRKSLDRLARTSKLARRCSMENAAGAAQQRCIRSAACRAPSMFPAPVRSPAAEGGAAAHTLTTTNKVLCMHGYGCAHDSPSLAAILQWQRASA